MRLVRSLDLDIYLDEAGAEPLFAPKAFGRTEVSEAEPPYTFIGEQNHGVLEVAPSGSESVPLGAITTGKALFLATDKPVSVTLNGGSALAVSAGSEGRGVLYLEADITSVQVDNAGLEAAKVVYALAGI